MRSHLIHKEIYPLINQTELLDSGEKWRGTGMVHMSRPNLIMTLDQRRDEVSHYGIECCKYNPKLVLKSDYPGQGIQHFNNIEYRGREASFNGATPIGHSLSSWRRLPRYEYICVWLNLARTPKWSTLRTIPEDLRDHKRMQGYPIMVC